MVKLRGILELVKPHWRILVAAALCSGVLASINGALAWMVKPMIDNVFVATDTTTLMMVAGGVVVLFFMRGLFNYLQNYLMSSIGTKIVRDVRNQLFSHMIRLPMAHYGTHSSATMLSRVINDAGMLQRFLVQRVKDLFVSSGTIVVLIGVALYRRWDLTLIALVVLPFSFYMVGIIGKRLKVVSERAQKQIARLTEILSEGLVALRVIKSFSMEHIEIDRFRHKSHNYYREQMRGTRLEEATTFIMEAVAGLGVGMIILYGGKLIGDKVMTTGDFLSFIAAVLMIYTPAKRVAEASNAFRRAEAYISRIDDVINRPLEREGSIDAPPIQDSLEFENLTFKYESRDTNALEGINLKVRRGEVIALVGRSGSGKTTMVDLIAKFYVPQEGCIKIDGIDINDLTLKALRSQLGMVGQQVMLFNDTVRANISYGRADATEDDVISAAKAAYAHEFIVSLPNGYDTLIGEGGVMLSGGQRQRLSIARAVLNDPQILILDEATSALDTQSELMVQRALDKLIEEGAQTASTNKKTIFIIAHRLSTIKMADRIVVLDRGKVVEVGTHAELLSRGGMYKRLHDLQFGDSSELDETAL